MLSTKISSLIYTSNTYTQSLAFEPIVLWVDKPARLFISKCIKQRIEIYTEPEEREGFTPVRTHTHTFRAKNKEDHVRDAELCKMYKQVLRADKLRERREGCSR